jgi:RNA polymerase sigma-70 factor (ECF subfamily)
MSRIASAKPQKHAARVTAPPRRRVPAPLPVPPCHRNDPGVELMLRVQQDEPDAFTELVERYWSSIFGRFYRQLGDRQEAEDLAQDVFMRLYRSRHRYQPKAKFSTWLFHIAQNVTRNALRTRRRHPCVPLGTLTGPEADAWPTNWPLTNRCEQEPSEPMERAETATVVRTAVAGLARRQRLALEMFQFHDRSCGEIAKRMDMSPKAARSLLYRARIQLRDCLSGQMEV